MAYMSQDKKKSIKAEMDKLLDKKLGWKFSMGVNNHSTLVLNIARGPVDFFGAFKAPNYDAESLKSIKSRNYMDINPYWFQEHFEPEVVELLSAIKDIMMDGNHDNSDIMTDYFDVGWYIDINIGKYGKPYELVYAMKEAA